MKMVVDMEIEDFKKALKFDEVKKSVEFFIHQEYPQGTTIEDFINIYKDHPVIEIMDTVEFDVDKSFARLLDRNNISYGRFILVNEDNSEDDRQSILDAQEIFDGLDIYSEFQNNWVN